MFFEEILLSEKPHILQMKHDVSGKKKKLDIVSESETDITSEKENVASDNTKTTPEKTVLSKNASMSPEQKERAEENHSVAKAKLLSKATNGVVVDIGVTWLKALEEEFKKPYFLQLSKFVSSERQKHTIYPPEQHVFSWTNMCPIQEVKVVILGQDPYHGPGQAHGLCFSVVDGIKPPPSLVNMYKELSSDIEEFTRPEHGCLSGWARQGVLLLNTVLTVQAHQANSHKDKGWEKFTDAVIRWLNRNNNGLIFLLWGSHAQKKGLAIDKKKHHILKAVHPSPLSAHRGFLGCKHFSQTNELLRKEGKDIIDWTNLPRQ